MKKEFVVIIIVALALLNLFQLGWNLFTHRLPWDAIPNEEAALVVGKALLASVYGGESELDRKITVTYDERREAWIIVAHLPDGYVGATPGIVFRKSDGKILEIDGGM